MIFEVILANCVIATTCVFFYRRRRITRPYRDIYVVITGCDTGFGRVAAEKFDGLGMHVFAGCLQEKSIQELRERCSDRIIPVLLDVTKTADIERLVCVVKERLPKGEGLSGLVNNAGISGINGLLESLGSEQYMVTFNVNFFGMVDVTKALMPLLRRGKGRIINTSSAAGKMASYFVGPYCATKHAMESYSDSLRRELYYDDVSVHIIEPGLFNTVHMFEDGYEDNPIKYFQELPDETREFYGEDMMTRNLILYTNERGFGPRYQNILKGEIHTSVSDKNDDLGFLIVLKSLDSWKEAADNKLDKVVNAYLHALTSPYPKIRYKVGVDAKILLPLISYMPEWVMDAFVGLQIPVPKGKQKK